MTAALLIHSHNPAQLVIRAPGSTCDVGFGFSIDNEPSAPVSLARIALTTTQGDAAAIGIHVDGAARRPGGPGRAGECGR